MYHFGFLLICKERSKSQRSTKMKVRAGKRANTWMRNQQNSSMSPPTKTNDVDDEVLSNLRAIKGRTQALSELVQMDDSAQKEFSGLFLQQEVC